MATAAAANESRGDLLNWVNDLLQLNITKIETMGTGAALCQIMDSIYGDVQMYKVKFGNIQPYECINNFKVLQTCFTNHGIDKIIPVERLIKMKFQDNLEFLQWMKKFWDANFPGGRYDAMGRRKGGGAMGIGNIDMSSNPSYSTTTNTITSGPMLKKLTTSAPITSPSLARPSSRDSSLTNHSSASSTLMQPPVTPGSLNQLQQQLAQATRKIQELEASIDEIEKERDFYFNKLREIEIATQQVADPIALQSSLFKSVTEILYKTEEGFEIPDGEPEIGLVRS